MRLAAQPAQSQDMAAKRSPSASSPGSGEDSPFVRGMRQRLDLDLQLRIPVAVVRVSARGRLDKLDDQLDSGVNVYRDDPDWKALREMSGTPRTWTGFHEVRYRDLDPRAANGMLGWVGVVGRTLFVCVADSAAERNLPALEGDVSGLGRNAFTELLIGMCIAANCAQLHVPFRSRWWRNDESAHHLMEALNRWLGSWQLWEGGVLVATAGAEKLSTGVVGATQSTYADTVKEAVFTKGLEKIKAGGEWDRRESELPLGLRRGRGPAGRKLLEVELDDEWLPVAGDALRMLAEGSTWDELADFLVEQRVPMRGARGVGKTFADYGDRHSRVAGAKTLLTNHRSLSWFETGTWVERRSTALAAPTGELRNHDIVHEDGRTVSYVETQMPHTQLLDPDQWAKVHRRLTSEREARNRRVGAAAHTACVGVAPFKGVPSWVVDDVENVLLPDSATSYRWRRRTPSTQGWQRDAGSIEATLRRPLFVHGCGQAMLEALRRLTDPLAPPATGGGDDPLDGLRARLAALETDHERVQQTLERLRDELLSETDPEECADLRERRNIARSEVRVLAAEIADLARTLEHGESAVVEETDHVPADVTEPVLVASLLLDGDGLVEPEVAEALDRYGVTRTVRLARVEGQDRMVRVTATATLPLLDGGSVDVDLQWDVPDSHGMPGRRATLPAVLRTWATGTLTVDEAAAGFPGYDGRDVHRVLRNLLARNGVKHRGLRAALLDCPLEAPRRIVAAHVLDEPELAAVYPEPLRSQVLDAYLGECRRGNSWCERADLEQVRQVLAVFADRPTTWDGLDPDAVALAAGVTRAFVRRLASTAGGRLLDSTEAGVVRPWRCRHGDCHGPALTAYVPAPEAGRGLVCPSCRRSDGPGVLGAEYLRPWRRTTAGYVTDAVPHTDDPRTERLITVSEVAARTGVAPHIVRALDGEGELVPDGRNGQGVRLYREDRVAALSEADLERWRARSSTGSTGGAETGPVLLTPAEAAARTGYTPRALRRLADADRLPVHCVGAHRRYSTDDLDRLVAVHPPEPQDRLVGVGEAAHRFGLPCSTLNDLASKGRIPHLVTSGGRRRYDPDEVGAALEDLGLRSSPDNPIVTIGELVATTGVSAGTIRRLSDAGVVPVAGLLGGKRRFRRRDAIAALEKAGCPPAAAAGRGDVGDDDAPSRRSAAGGPAA